MREAPFLTETGVFVNPQAQNHRRSERKSEPTNGQLPAMSSEEFAKMLHRAVFELQEAKSSSGRSARLNDVGGP